MKRLIIAKFPSTHLDNAVKTYERDALGFNVGQEENGILRSKFAPPMQFFLESDFIILQNFINFLSSSHIQIFQSRQRKKKKNDSRESQVFLSAPTQSRACVVLNSTV